MTAALSRFGPLVGLTLFFGIGILWRTWLHRRRYGHSGVALFRRVGWWDSSRDMLVLVLPVVLGVFALGQALVPGSTSVGRLSVFEFQGAVALGAGLMVAGVVLMAAAQLQMGKSWRIGIDESARPGLVTEGLYRFCRNPIYTAALAALLGLMLLAPSL